MNWKEVADVNITADQFIACSIAQSHVTVWVVHLQVTDVLSHLTTQKLRPFAKDQIIFDPPSDVKSSLNMDRTSEALKILQGSTESIGIGEGTNAAKLPTKSVPTNELPQLSQVQLPS